MEWIRDGFKELKKADGWEALGNEVDGKDIMEALLEIISGKED